jgi:hypothetical protein
MSSATQHASGLMAVQGINLNTLEALLTETSTALSIKLSDSSFVVVGLMLIYSSWLSNSNCEEHVLLNA